MTAICSPAERPDVISKACSSEPADRDGAFLKSAGRPHENHTLAANRLERCAGNTDFHRLFFDHDAGCHDCTRAPDHGLVVDLGDHACRACIGIHKRADEYDLSFASLPAVFAAGNRDRLAFRDHHRDLPWAPPARPKPLRDRRSYKDRMDRPACPTNDPTSTLRSITRPPMRERISYPRRLETPDLEALSCFAAFTTSAGSRLSADSFCRAKSNLSSASRKVSRA